MARLQTLVLAEPVRTQAEVQHLLVAARELGSRQHEAQALVLLGGCAFFMGQYQDMLDISAEVVQLSREIRSPQMEARALNGMGLAYHRLGQLDQAMAYLLDSLRLCTEQRDEEGSCRALSNIAMLHVALGEYETAVTLHEQALEMARACGNAALISDTLGSLLDDHFKLRQFEQAFDLSDEAIGFPRERGLVRFECAARTYLSLILLYLGRGRAALLNAEAGLALATYAEDQESRLGLLLAQGQAQLLLGQMSQAETVLQEALELSRELQHREHEWQAHEALARLYDTQGKVNLSREHYLLFNQNRQEIYAQEARQRTLTLAEQAQKEWQYRNPTGQYSWSHELNGLMSSLKQARTELALISTFDLLTGVANRSHFQMRAQRRLDLLVDGEGLGIVVVGLDFMRALNERFGHSVGDSVLVEMARRLQSMVRAGDLVGRLGSDEFVVMLSHLAAPEDIDLVMGRLLHGLREPFMLRGQPVRITASVGGAVYPGDGSLLEELFRNADLAMQQAKSQGRDLALRFDPHMRTAERRRANLLYDLQSAVPQGELRLYYQSQYSLPERRLTGVEALVRWQHPELGLIPPTHFIQLAEENRFILEIGDWVLNEASRQAQLWKFGPRGLKMSVNVSALQFEQPNFVSKVQAALQQHQLQGPELVLELTESMMHTDEQRTRTMLEELQELGVQVALDDFGAGFSSLGSLQKLHLNYLKLDRTFMDDLSRHAAQFARARMLMDMMINLAHNINMVVIAEGIEHDEQLEVLNELGCDQVQGFLLARPVPAHDLEEMFRATFPEEG